MSKLIFISRNYTEFGGFSDAEVRTFAERGVFKHSDFLHHEGLNDWVTVGQWLESNTEKHPTTAKPKPAAKKAAASPAPAPEAPPAKTAKKTATKTTAKVAKKAAPKKG